PCHCKRRTCPTYGSTTWLRACRPRKSRICKGKVGLFSPGSCGSGCRFGGKEGRPRCYSAEDGWLVEVQGERWQGGAFAWRLAGSDRKKRTRSTGTGGAKE